MKTHIINQLTEFKALDFSEKICLVGSWVAGCGATLLLSASAATLICWGTDKEPGDRTKQCMFIGFGMLVGGTMFTTGAAMEDDRLTEEIAETFYKKLAEKRAQRESSPCPNCKFFTGNCDLYCAVNPVIACTPEATDCKDFEPKEINS